MPAERISSESPPTRSRRAVIRSGALALGGLAFAKLQAIAEAQQATGLAAAWKNAFRIGVAVSNQALEGKADAQLDLIAREFNSVTAENAMKWGVIRPDGVHWQWERADRLVEFAETGTRWTWWVIRWSGTRRCPTASSSTPTASRCPAMRCWRRCRSTSKAWSVATKVACGPGTWSTRPSTKARDGAARRGSTSSARTSWSGPSASRTRWTRRRSCSTTTTTWTTRRSATSSSRCCGATWIAEYRSTAWARRATWASRIRTWKSGSAPSRRMPAWG